MSLAARRALYFSFSVGAQFRLTPLPTTQKEVTFIYESFQKISQVDYFQIAPSKHSSTNVFGRIVNVLFNVTDQASQLDPLSGIDPSVDAKADALRQRRKELRKYLSSICALPRFSYIEHDQQYWQGRMLVTLKHRLSDSDRQYTDQYKLSTSTVDLPFITLETEHEHRKVVAAMRHNFQNFHKIEPLFLWSGLGAALLLGAELLPSVKVTTNNLGDMDLIDLHKQPMAHAVHWKPLGFVGFEKY